jgi:hypothetical protein
MIRRFINWIKGAKKAENKHPLSKGFYVPKKQGKPQVLFEVLESGKIKRYVKQGFDIDKLEIESIDVPFEEYKTGVNSSPTLESMIEMLNSRPKLKLHTYYIQGKGTSLYYVYGIHDYRLDVLKINKTEVKKTSIYTHVQGNFTEISPKEVAARYATEQEAHKVYFENKNKQK